MKRERGFALIEIVLAITIFTFFSLGIFYLSVDTLQRDSKMELNDMGLFYANEGIEAVRNMRDRNYLLLTNGDHGLQFQNETWGFIPAPEAIDNFYERTVTIDDVYRDINGNINGGSGTLDPDTKKIISEVNWNFKGVFPQSITLTTYLSNWTGEDLVLGNCDELNLGTFDGTETTPLPAPPDNNCGVRLDFEELPSDFFSSVNLGKHGNDVVVDGSYAYLAADDTTNGFAVIDISNPAAPAVAMELAVGGKGRKLFKNGDYVYLGVQKTNQGIAIINVSTPNNPSVTNSWNAGGYGNQPFATATHLYVTIEDDNNSFKVYSLNPAPQLRDFLDIDEETHSVEVNGNYAYLATEEDDLGLRIVDISNPSNINQVAALDLGEEANIVKIRGLFAYVGIEDGDASLRVINIANPLAPQEVASLDVEGEINDIAFSGDYLYAAIDDTNAGLAAINIADTLYPTLSYNLDINGKGTGIAATEDHIFISTDTANNGLVIAGTTTSAPQTSGTYISNSYDSGSNDTRYNFLSWEHQEVPGGSISFQIRTADTLANLNNATWVGSDGTNGSHYTVSRTPLVLDPNRTGVRYFQLKAFFTSDGANTPILDTIRINYNP